MFKLSGKIMDGIIPQLVGDLREIHLLAAYELLGGVYLHNSEIIDDTAARMVFEHLLQK